MFLLASHFQVQPLTINMLDWLPSTRIRRQSGRLFSLTYKNSLELVWTSPNIIAVIKWVINYGSRLLNNVEIIWPLELILSPWPSRVLGISRDLSVDSILREFKFKSIVNQKLHQEFSQIGFFDLIWDPLFLIVLQKRYNHNQQSIGRDATLIGLIENWNL